jgi:hypothetical protein
VKDSATSARPRRTRFQVDSEGCELLLAFRDAESLERLARALARDVSVVSRGLTRISDTTNALEKRQGRWALTPSGHALAAWTEKAIKGQADLLEGAAPALAVLNTWV